MPGQGQGGVFFTICKAHNDGKVQEALVEAVQDGFGVATIEMADDQGIRVVQAF